MTQKILAYTKVLSIKVKGNYVDIVRAHNDIEIMKVCLKDKRTNVDVFQDHLL